MLLPNRPSTTLAKIKIKTEEANPSKRNPARVLTWLNIKMGFLPKRSLSFPVIGLANNWHKLNRLKIKPTWNAFKPKDNPRNGRTGMTMLKPKISVKIIK